MTDPFDTVREALSRVGSALNLSDLRSRSSTEFYDAAIDSLAEALTSLASIEENLRHTHANLDVCIEQRQAAERERDDLRQKRDNVGTLAVEEIIGRSKAEIRIAELEQERDEYRDLWEGGRLNTNDFEARAETAERERDEWKQSNNLLIEENYGLAASLEAAERELASAKVEIIDWKLAKADSDRERDALQHIIDCADTPLMRDVLRERDEALHAEEVAEQYREKAEARVAELEAASRPLPA